MVSLVTKGALQLAVLSFFTRFLTPGEFGVVNIVTAFLVFVVLFTEIGLGPALIQKLAIDKKHVSTAFLSSVLFASFIYLLLYTGAPLIALFYKVPELKNAIRFTGLSFVFSSFGVVSGSLLKRDMQFKILMYIDLSAFLLSYCLVGVVMAYLGYGIWAYLTSIVVQSILLALFLFLAKPHAISLQLHRQEFKELFHFAGSLTLEKIFNTIGRQGDVFTTGRFLGMIPLGIYGRANQLMDIPNQYLGQALDNVLFPAMSRKQGEKETLAATYLKGGAIVNLFMFPLSAFIILYAPQIIHVVFGPNWDESVLILQILCLVLPFKTSVKITDSLVRAMGAFYAGALMKFFYAISIIVLTIAGSFYGLEGVAIGVNISVLFNYMLMTRLARKLTGFRPGDYYRTYLPGILLASAILLINLPVLYFLHSCSGISSLLVLACAALYNGVAVFYLLFFHPRWLGPTWEWMLSHLLDFIPSGNRSVNFIKIYFTKKITS